MRLFIFFSLVLVLGCGTASDPVDLSNTTVEDTKAIVVRGGKEGITVIPSAEKRKVRYLGIIENNGNQTFCFVDITFSTKGADGKSVDQQQAVTRTINGFTLTHFGDEIHSCLGPGQFGSFDTGELPLAGEFADFDFSICIGRNGICKTFPLAKEPRVTLIPVNLTLGEINGMRVFSGQVRNDADPVADPKAIAYDVTIHFTVLNEQGKVVSTAASETLRAQPCGEIQAQNPTSCIGPVVLTEPFTVDTKTPVAATCDGCYYFRVYHSE